MGEKVNVRQLFPHHPATLRPDRIEILDLNGFSMHVLIINGASPGDFDAPQHRLMYLHGTANDPGITPNLWRLAKDHDATIICPYLPCHGRSDRVSTFPQLVDVLGLTAEWYGTSGDVLIGHSLGGFLAVCVAASRPKLASAIVTLAMPTSLPTRGLEFYRLMTALTIDASITTAYAWVASLFSGKTHMVSSALASSVLRSSQYLDLFEVLRGAPHLSTVMPHIKVPVSGLFGGADLAVRVPTCDMGPYFEATLLRGASHNFPQQGRAYPAISRAVQAALGASAASSDAVAPVVPLFPPQSLPAS